VRKRHPVQHRRAADSRGHHRTERGSLTGDQHLGRNEQAMLIDAVGQRSGPRP
jgi:hypothetical protein